MTEAPRTEDQRSPLNLALGTLYLAKRDEADPEGCECRLSADQATALWEHIQQARKILEPLYDCDPEIRQWLAKEKARDK